MKRYKKEGESMNIRHKRTGFIIGSVFDYSGFEIVQLLNTNKYEVVQQTTP